jgi:hypothetical protein
VRVYLIKKNLQEKNAKGEFEVVIMDEWDFEGAVLLHKAQTALEQSQTFFKFRNFIASFEEKLCYIQKF